MRIENVNGYWYLVEWWYDKKRHRSLPTRVRVSDELVAFMKKNELDETWLMNHETDEEGRRCEEEIDVPKKLARERDALMTSFSDKGGSRNQKWQRWNIIRQELLHDSALENYKQPFESKDKRWIYGTMHQVDEIVKHAPKLKKTPAWEKFLADYERDRDKWEAFVGEYVKSCRDRNV